MRRLFLMIILLGSALGGWAQYESKYSNSTQMFLSERRGDVQLPNSKTKVSRTMVPMLPVGASDLAKMRTQATRPIAEVELVDSKEMISAFIGLSDNNFSAIEALGAVVQSKFDKLVAALIPVDKIEEVAALDNVTKIEVAEVLKVSNDRQRQATQAGDAIVNSAMAQALGLTKQYTGKGVVLGIVDTGIDFQHIAFKDESGKSRIVRAYKLSGSTSTSLTTYSTATDIAKLTYDTNLEDHGTHTSSTAGGSSVIVNGNNVTVTDDHANATYGGMAPEADLVIAGLSSLYTTSIGTAIQNICNYADQVGKPCVISLSLGSQDGPHDGTGSLASIVNQCAGNNHIIVYASSNDAMRYDYFKNIAGTSNGGGCYAGGSSSKSRPMMANLQRSWADATGNVQLYASTINAYARTKNVATALKFHVVDTSTGDIVYSTQEYTSGTTIGITTQSGLGQYFYSTSDYSNPYGDAGKIRISRSTSNSKYYWTIHTPVMISRSYSKGSGDIYDSKYALCVSVYPTTNTSTVIDMWETYGVDWFGNDLLLSSTAAGSYNLVQGSDDCSVSDNACYEKVITVGAYVTKNTITNYAGTVHDWSEDYPNIGDHASFSSYQAAGSGPLGTALPTINAPGARIVAGINHYHTKAVDADYSYWGDDFIGDLVVNNTTNAYGAMEGTSMATPCASGIIAQWLQACIEAGKTPTPDYIKEVITATADTDAWTDGTAPGAHGAKTFGPNGKINAVRGLQYILGTSAEPTIRVQPTSLAFNTYATLTSEAKVSVRGMLLDSDINISLSDDNNVFSVSQESITVAQAASGTELTVTFSPQEAGNYSGTITVTSEGAESVDIALNATAEAATPTIIPDKQALDFSAQLNTDNSQTFTISGRFINSNVTLTMADANHVFSVSPTTLSPDDVNGNGAEVSVTFNSSAEGTFNAILTIASEGAEAVSIALTATANDGGTASDAYLNIAKYATIDEAGWNTTFVKTLYNYTTYDEDQVAWLTLPVYGAFVGARYAVGSSTFNGGHPQKWIDTNVNSNNNKYYGTSWSSSDILLGSGPYFTDSSGNGAPRVMGYNYKNNTTQETVTFYVTNVTAVKLMGLGQSRSTSKYPTTLKIYECSVGDDGTVTASSSAVANESNSATSGSFVLSATDLDASKVYKVEAGTYRSYISEIGFQTPLPKPVLMGDVNHDGNITIADVTALVNIILGKDTDKDLDLKATDMNHDGQITIADVTALVNIILSK